MVLLMPAFITPWGQNKTIESRSNKSQKGILIGLGRFVIQSVRQNPLDL